MGECASVVIFFSYATATAWRRIGSPDVRLSTVPDVQKSNTSSAFPPKIFRSASSERFGMVMIEG